MGREATHPHFADIDMMRRLATSGVLLAMTVVGLLLCLDVAYFVHGSLEEFPTAEQEDKIRRVTAALAVALVVAELGLAALLRHLWRSAAPGGRDSGRSSRPTA